MQIERLVEEVSILAAEVRDLQKKLEEPTGPRA
jgi:hypothetical protein